MTQTKRSALWQDRLQRRAAAAAKGLLTSRLVIELDREGARDLLAALGACIEQVSIAMNDCESVREEESLTRQLALLGSMFEGVHTIVSDNGWQGSGADGLDADDASEGA